MPALPGFSRGLRWPWNVSRTECGEPVRLLFESEFARNRQLALTAVAAFRPFDDLSSASSPVLLPFPFLSPAGFLSELLFSPVAAFLGMMVTSRWRCSRSYQIVNLSSYQLATRAVKASESERSRAGRCFSSGRLRWSSLPCFEFPVCSCVLQCQHYTSCPLISFLEPNLWERWDSSAFKLRRWLPDVVMSRYPWHKQFDSSSVAFRQ